MADRSQCCPCRWRHPLNERRLGLGRSAATAMPRGIVGKAEAFRMVPAVRAFDSQIRELLPDLERVYTDIHAHPELSMQETRTASVAADRLRAAGFEVTPGVGTT